MPKGIPLGTFRVTGSDGRRIDLVWEGDDIEMYQSLKQKAVSLEKELPELIKEIIETEIKANSNG